MKPIVYARALAREFRGARTRLVYFVLCLSLGVGAVVAVSSFSSALERGIRGSARELLAADLAITGRQPLPPAALERVLQELAEQGLPGIQRAHLFETGALVAALPRADPPRADLPRTDTGASERAGSPAASLLAEVKVVDGPYPFYGDLVLEPAAPLGELLRSDAVVVAPQVLERLGVRLGDSVSIGGVPFRIAAVVRREPDRLGAAFAFAPRVLLSRAGHQRTLLNPLFAFGLHKTLLRLPDDAQAADLERVAARLRIVFGTTRHRVETYREAQPIIRRSLDRIDRFLALVALLTLLIGGVGVAQTVRSWLVQRLDALAVQKSLGMRPRELFVLYLLQSLLLGLLGSALGALFGAAAPWVVPRIVGDLLPAEVVRTLEPGAMTRGVALGLGTTLLFSLPPLLLVLRVPAARVLRRNLEPLPGRRLVTAVTTLAVVGAVVGMAALQARAPEIALGFTGAVLGTGALLVLAARVVVLAVARLPRDWFAGRVALRHGLAALARPGAATLAAMVALGLGLLVVLSMALGQRHLDDELTAELPAEAPSTFLVDVQPEQWPAIEQVLRARGATNVQSVPIIAARLRSVGGREVEELARGRAPGEGRWALLREQRLSFQADLPSDNTLVAGRWFTGDGVAEVSVEQEFARELGVAVGERLVLEVGGSGENPPVELLITSLRAVDWENFRINFFLVVEPGVLDSAPQRRVSAARLPPGTEQQVQDEVARSFPNVAVVQVRDVLDKIGDIVRRVSWGIRFLGGFTVVAGLVILSGAIAASTLRRGRQVALLKAIGMTRRDVVATFATEYALIGLVAGAVGALGAGVLAYFVLTRGMEIEWRFRPGLFAATTLAGAALAILGGLLASRSALRKRPIEALREA